MRQKYVMWKTPYNTGSFLVFINKIGAIFKKPSKTAFILFAKNLAFKNTASMAGFPARSTLFALVCGKPLFCQYNNKIYCLIYQMA